ncbi:MAG TPA: tetratricopeptide repeat protein, partial [Cyclobacteriaceae bacterium]|nr:tetratricopeptide repeat protein [Cyclobacteriaceae bacterium]
MRITPIIILIAITTAAYAQKSELKAIDSLIRSGKFTEAEGALKKIRGDEGSVKSYYGLLYMMQSRYDLALENLLAAIDQFEKSGQSTSLEAAEALVHLGNVYRSTGKYSQAEEQLNHALLIRQEKLPGNHELIAAVYNDLGMVYIELDRDKSIEYYEKALETYRKLHGENDPKIAIANTNLGIVYAKEKLYGDAINYYETALKIWDKVYPDAHANKALVLMNLGETYSSLGDQKAAQGYYEKSLAMYEAALGKKHPEAAFAHTLLGNQKISQRNFDEGLKHYQLALIANISSFSDEDITRTPVIKDYYNGRQLLFSLMYKARALEKKYYGKSLRFDELLLGLTTLQACDSLIDQLRQGATNE